MIVVLCVLWVVTKLFIRSNFFQNVGNYLWKYTEQYSIGKSYAIFTVHFDSISSIITNKWTFCISVTSVTEIQKVHLLVIILLIVSLSLFMVPLVDYLLISQSFSYVVSVYLVISHKVFFSWLDSRRGPRPPHYRGFEITLRCTHTHTHTHATLGRTPLDEWSARRRDL
jgi:hypothetical protein